MPDTTLTQAIKEAYASAPVAEIIYHTLEIWHPNFTNSIFVVRGNQDITAVTEDDVTVDYISYAFEVIPPVVATTSLPQCTIEIDNISQEIIANIELAMNSVGTPITVIYRCYLASDLTVPANNPPITLTVMTISVDIFKVRAVCGFYDMINRKFPTDKYTTEAFPGLT